jgi:pimeloyl-ACP methyl ester carboxylesterase
VIPDRAYSFQIDSDEGLPIRGVVDVPEGAVALVVTIHGFKGFKDWGFFPWTSEAFSEARIASCRFDFSRNGIGTGSTDTFERLDLFEDDTYSIELADLRAVVRHLETIDALNGLPRFLFGHSRGGGIAILGARDIPNLRGVVTWSAISDLNRWDADTVNAWRATGALEIENARTRQMMRVSTKLLDDLEANAEALDVPRALGALEQHLLVIHGASDETVPIEEATRIHDLAPNASLVVIENASHTMCAAHPLVHVPKELRLAMGLTKKFVHAWTGLTQTDDE